MKLWSKSKANHLIPKINKFSSRLNNLINIKLWLNSYNEISLLFLDNISKVRL